MAEYIYFCSSLPFLRYGVDPPISLDSFLSSAATNLSVADYDKLKDLDFSRVGLRVDEFFCEYYRWELALRNHVLVQRLKLLDHHSEKAKIRSGGVGSVGLSAEVEQILQQDPLAAERSLDRLRWDKLAELSGSRLFDMVFLACYVLKLQILERRMFWDKQQGIERYERVCDKIVENENVGAW